MPRAKRAGRCGYLVLCSGHGEHPRLLASPVPEPLCTTTPPSGRVRHWGCAPPPHPPYPLGLSLFWVADPSYTNVAVWSLLSHPFCLSRVFGSEFPPTLRVPSHVFSVMSGNSGFCVSAVTLKERKGLNKILGVDNAKEIQQWSVVEVHGVEHSCLSQWPWGAT